MAHHGESADPVPQAPEQRLPGPAAHPHPGGQTHDHGGSGHHEHRRGHGHHGHGHHGHGRGASGSAARGRRRLILVLAITLVVLSMQVIGALVSGSLALLADTGHVLTDAAGLALALLAALLAARPPTPGRTWGFLRAEVLAAGAQATVLLAVGGFVLVEGVRRLLHPTEIEPVAMALFGAVGLVGNLIAILVLATGSRENLNLRAAFLEVVNDALGSAAVVASAILIALTGWTRFDPIASLLIAVLIVPRTLLLLWEAISVLLESTPPGLDLARVREHLLEVDHVLGVHDLHATLVATGLPVLTAHVVVDDSCFHDGHVPQMLDALQRCLASHFEIEHSTLQVEPREHAEKEHGRHA